MLYQTYQVLLSLFTLLTVFSLKSTNRKQFFATTVPGLEKVLYEEISHLSDVFNIAVSSSGVSFEGSVKTGLESLLWLRTSLKVMEKLAEGKNLKTKDDLYELCTSVDWLSMLSMSNTIKCDAVLGRDNPAALSHTHFNSLTIKNAIIDTFRNAHGTRPNVDIVNPDMTVMLYLHKGKATLYKAWSGDDSMHKRGYRDLMHKAVLRETTSAAILMMMDVDFPAAFKDPSFMMMDPMCGSGTIAIEAALMMTDTAPGLLKYGSGSNVSSNNNNDNNDNSDRKIFLPPKPVSRWLTDDSTRSTWEDVFQTAQQRDKRQEYQNLPTNNAIKIITNDIHPRAIDLARSGAENAGVRHLIDFLCADVRNINFREADGSKKKTSPSVLPCIMIANPPWDLRLEGADGAWEALGDFAQRNMGDDGGDLWTLSGNPALSKHLHLPQTIPPIRFSAAGLDLEFAAHPIGPID